MHKCVFCQLSQDKVVKVWESDCFYALFDAFPVSPGHTLIIPKRHIVGIEELDEKEWNSLRMAIREIINIIEKTDLKAAYEKMSKNPTSDISTWFLQKAINHPRINTKPDAYNHGVNDGKAAGRTIDHLHWHVIPRYAGDVNDPRGGVRYVIPEMGNYRIQRD
jgi:diadenosine tetraphosphate (Ap4A) HIT family hydrolase